MIYFELSYIREQIHAAEDHTCETKRAGIIYHHEEL